MASPHADKLRFLVAGSTTTLATYVLYWLLLLAMDPRIAYAIAYVCGIVMSYSINSRWVFQRSWSHVGLLTYAVGYGAQALLSYAIFLALLAWTPVPAWLAPVLVTLLLLPLTFMMSRELIHRTSPTPETGAGADP